MARLDMSQRRELNANDFVYPEKAPGHGSYPIPDRDHAIAALRFAAGTPEEAHVRETVCARYKVGCPK